MTKKQIRKKLSIYLDKHDFDIPSLEDMVDFAQEVANEATKELQGNGVVWHDLRKNPNDLPERDKTFVTEVSVTVVVYPLGFAVYYFFDKKWYSNGKEVKVDRWCEIPQFKE